MRNWLLMWRLFKYASQAAILIAFLVAVLFWMPVDRRIVYSNRHYPDPTHNVEIFLKGKVFYVTPEEKIRYENYKYIFLFGIGFGVLGMVIVRVVKKSKL